MRAQHLEMRAQHLEMRAQHLEMRVQNTWKCVRNTWKCVRNPWKVAYCSSIVRPYYSLALGTLRSNSYFYSCTTD